MKKLYPIYLAALACLCNISRSEAQTSYSNLYAVPSGEMLTVGYHPTYVIPAADNGFFWGGGRGVGIEYGNSFLVRTNADGSTRFSSTSTSPVTAKPALTTDGGFLWATNTMTGMWGHELDRTTVVRLDSMGQQLWRYAYYPTDSANAQYPNHTYSGGFGMQVLVTGESRLLGCIKTYSAQTWTPDLQKAAMLKLGANGDLLQSRLFASTTYEIEFTSAQPTADGGFIVTGTSKLFNDYTSAGGILAKFDAQENLEWAKRYTNQAYETVSGVLQLPDGGYLTYGISGNGNAAGYVRKLAANGDVVWSKLLNDGSNLHNHLSSALLMADSTILVSAGLNGNESRRVLLRFNQLGDTISTHMDNTGYRGSFPVAIAPNGSFVYASASFQPVPASNYSSYLPYFTQHAAGQQPFSCGTSYFAFPITNQAIIANPLPLTETNGGMVKQAAPNLVYDAGLVGSPAVCSVLGAPEQVATSVTVAAFPNPANNQLTLQLATETQLQNTYEVVVYAITGQEQYRTQALGTNQLHLNTSQWATGLYLYRVYSNNKTVATGKVVIEK